MCQSVYQQVRYVEARERLQAPAMVNLHLTPLGQGLSQNPRLVVRLATPPGNSRDPPVSPSQHWDSSRVQSCSALFVGAGDLNLDPQACLASVVNAPTHRASSPARNEGLILTFIFISFVCESTIVQMPKRTCGISLPRFHCVGPRKQMPVVRLGDKGQAPPPAEPSCRAP